MLGAYKAIDKLLHFAIELTYRVQSTILFFSQLRAAYEYAVDELTDQRLESCFELVFITQVETLFIFGLHEIWLSLFLRLDVLCSCSNNFRNSELCVV
jgi:hypothetical protein